MENIWLILGPTNLPPNFFQGIHIDINYQIQRGCIFFTETKKIDANKIPMEKMKCMLQILDESPTNALPRYTTNREPESYEVFVYEDVLTNYEEEEQDDLPCHPTIYIRLENPIMIKLLRKGAKYYDENMQEIIPIKSEKEIEDWNKKEKDECSALNYNTFDFF